MNFVNVPLDSDNASFRETVSLAGKSVILEFSWNERAARWHMNVFDASEGPILMGVPLHINSDLVGRFKIPDMPQGYMVMFDVSQKLVEIGRDELGERGVFLFVDRREVTND